jgi:plasmid stability protein
MTDTETIIMIKNMAREMVRGLAVKNATEHGSAMKEEVRKRLTDHGVNPADANKMISKHFDTVSRAASTAKRIAELIMSAWSNE